MAMKKHPTPPFCDYEPISGDVKDILVRDRRGYWRSPSQA